MKNSNSDVTHCFLITQTPFDFKITNNEGAVYPDHYTGIMPLFLSVSSTAIIRCYITSRSYFVCLHSVISRKITRNCEKTIWLYPLFVSLLLMLILMVFVCSRLQGTSSLLTHNSKGKIAELVLFFHY